MSAFGIDEGNGRRAVDAPNGWDPAGTCGSGLADAVAFTPSIAASEYDWCADMNCDDAVTISDAVTLTPFLSGSIACPGDAGPWKKFPSFPLTPCSRIGHIDGDGSFPRL